MAKTFKVNHTAYNWDGLCEEISEPMSNYLGVRHVKSKKRDHVHIYIEHPNDQYKKRLKLLQDELKEPHQRQGPVKQSTKDIDPNFINYMVKEEGWDANIVANRGFSEEELIGAHEQSETYCKEAKEGLKIYIKSHEGVYEDPEEMFMSYRILTLKYYKEMEKYLVYNPRWRILSIMLHLHDSKDVRSFIANNI